MTDSEAEWNGHDNWLAAGRYIAREKGVELDPRQQLRLLNQFLIVGWNRLETCLVKLILRIQLC